MFQPGRTASMWNWCMQASFGIAPLCLVVEASHAFRHQALESNQLICVQSFSLHIFSCTSSQCQHLQEQQSHREWSARCLHLRIETRCTCLWIAPLHVMCYQIILWHLRFLKSLLHDGPSSPAVSSVAASASSEKQCVESKAETIPGPCDGDKPRSKKIVYFDLDSILDFQAIQTQAGAEKPPDPMSNFRKRPNYDGSRRKLLKVDKDRRSQLGVTYYNIWYAMLGQPEKNLFACFSWVHDVLLDALKISAPAQAGRERQIQETCSATGDLAMPVSSKRLLSQIQQHFNDG